MRPLPSVQRLLSARAAEKVAQSTSTSGVSVCGEKSSWRARGAAREAKSYKSQTRRRGQRSQRGDEGQQMCRKRLLYPDSEGALTLLARALAVRLSGADTGDLSGCRAAVRHCQVPLSDQLSGAVSAVGCCRVRV